MTWMNCMMAKERLGAALEHARPHILEHACGEPPKEHITPPKCRVYATATIEQNISARLSAEVVPACCCSSYYRSAHATASAPAAAAVCTWEEHPRLGHLLGGVRYASAARAGGGREEKQGERRGEVGEEMEAHEGQQYRRRRKKQVEQMLLIWNRSEARRAEDEASRTSAHRSISSDRSLSPSLAHCLRRASQPASWPFRTHYGEAPCVPCTAGAS